ncbi:MAG: hypothetical protein JOS17DRAFT_767661 [Linnemannia elongata]|nr:MAG: hypothetical protein JOS17DRAFT_767661 [Linnemannia elongata]
MSAAKTLSPLEVPEILEQILAYVDDDTINDAVLLVCKQWYWMTQHRHIREAVWNTHCASTTGDGPSGIESTLPTAHRLYCYLHVGSRSEEQRQIYKRLRTTLIHNHNQQIGVPSRRLIEEQAVAATASIAVQERLHETLLDIERIGDMDTKDIPRTNIITSTTGTRHRRSRRPRRQHLAPGAPPLHEVVFETFSRLLSTHIYPLLPFLYSITSLTIRCVEFSSFNQLRMPDIMVWCPYLEDLRIDTSNSIRMSGPWFRPPDATLKTPHTELRLKPTRFVSLVLVNVSVKYQDLQDLLEVSPWLKDLRVVFTMYNERKEDFFDCEKFVSYARTFFFDNNRQPLEMFHASVKGEPIKDTEIEERMFGLCPTTSDITVQLQDFRLVLLDVLQSRPNVITSLEIVNGDGLPSEVLLRYLCVSPHLLYLKASKVGIIVEDMGRSSSSHVDAAATVESTTTVPKIWACRNIRTLQICFFTRHSFDSQDRGGSGAAVCRWVFGYISRVCPRLRYLEIVNIESMEFDAKLSYKGKMFPGCMALESGFCLLARLKELRWIRLGAYDVHLDVKSVDMSWILLADEASQTRRVERQNVVSTWMIEQDLGLSEGQPNEGNVKVSDSLLRQVGTLQDVKAMIDEMNAVESFECWPCLRGITICRQGGYGQDRKQEVDRILQEAAQRSAVSSTVCSVQPKSNRFSNLLSAPFSFLRGAVST